MSAWLVTDVHLSAIIQQAIVEGHIDPSEADEYWLKMRMDNLYALHVRYGDRMPERDDVEVVRSSVEAPLNPRVIAKSINCWSYQCAEFDGYTETTAHIMADQLLAKLMDKYNFTHDTMDPDSTLPWGLQSWGDAIDLALLTPNPRKWYA